MPDIYFPPTCDLKHIFSFCREIEALFYSKNITIDFSRMGRIEPFVMVYTAKHIRDFNRKRKKHSLDFEIHCTGYDSKKYAANMAFFRAFGLRHGREPNCVGGNNNFIPFTILRVNTVIEEAHKKYIETQEEIEERASKLARVLARQDSGNLIDALTFSIREMMRNVVEHSESKFIEYCAQYWPSYNCVEIVISDNGIGMKESLSHNPFIEAENDSEAIQLALMPSISGKNYKGAKINTSNPWHNSGFGLYMISRICKLGGSFLICSGDHAIFLNEKGKEHLELGHYHEGTVIRMILNTKNLGSLSLMLAKFRDDGYLLATEIKNAGIYHASAASQMLSRDFNK
ncbi:hypothetical protein [Morganella psychrotolerans]|uniref:hypothetical protein n=1 Tax=Morganella psychrotolerans TaxID=368603 RepID=UPI0039AFE7D9